MINILLDDLPCSVEVSGIAYPVNWGYRTMVLIEIGMFDSGRSEEQRMLDALNLFYGPGNIPPDIPSAIEMLMWFYRCGKAEKKEEQRKKGAPVKQSKRSYCFEQDAPYIYAAFQTQYRVDLNATKSCDLHWWKFHAMFEAFSEDLKISKIMYYRTVSLTGLPKEKRKFLNEMKKLYALDEPDQTVDSRLRLARRNADMKAYVKRRALEVHGNDEDKVSIS